MGILGSRNCKTGSEAGARSATGAGDSGDVGRIITGRQVEATRSSLMKP